ncbi:MAG: response regulator [Proteobacteria bacterium]|nr:response regulator [Pseudomonadota bacterium]
MTGRRTNELARTHQPHLVPMDLQMPEVNGLDATRIIKSDRQTPRAIPVIALTAYAMKKDENEAYQAGCGDYLSKPIDIGRLLEKVAKHQK